MLIQFICIQFRNISLAAIGCLLDGLISMIDCDRLSLFHDGNRPSIHARDCRLAPWRDRNLIFTRFSFRRLGSCRQQIGWLRQG